MPDVGTENVEVLGNNGRSRDEPEPPLSHGFSYLLIASFRYLLNNTSIIKISYTFS